MYAIKKFRGETLTLATSVAFATVRGVPPGMNALAIEVPSATLENIAVGFGPKIEKVYFYDRSDNQFHDITKPVTDRNTSTLGHVGGLVTGIAPGVGDALFVGCKTRFRGLAIDMTTVNAVVAAATWAHPTSPNEAFDDAWTSIAHTDGTETGGNTTLGQDGLVTWTAVPTNWVQSEVNGEKLFWARFTGAATLTTLVTIDQISALFNNVVNSVDSDAEGLAVVNIRSQNTTKEPYWFYFNSGDVGSVEMSSASITSAANLNWCELAPFTGR